MFTARYYGDSSSWHWTLGTGTPCSSGRTSTAKITLRILNHHTVSLPLLPVLIWLVLYVLSPSSRTSAYLIFRWFSLMGVPPFSGNFDAVVRGGGTVPFYCPVLPGSLEVSRSLSDCAFSFPYHDSSRFIAWVLYTEVQTRYFRYFFHLLTTFREGGILALNFQMRKHRPSLYILLMVTRPVCDQVEIFRAIF